MTLAERLERIRRRLVKLGFVDVVEALDAVIADARRLEAQHEARLSAIAASGPLADSCHRYVPPGAEAEGG